MPVEDLLAVVSAHDGITTIPLDRWDAEAHFTSAEHCAALFAAFMPSIAEFDAIAFSMGDAEVCLLDPQQRILLELGWEVRPPTARCRSSCVIGASPTVGIIRLRRMCHPHSITTDRTFCYL